MYLHQNPGGKYHKNSNLLLDSSLPFTKHFPVFNLAFSKQVLKAHINILTLQTKVNKAQRSSNLPNPSQLLNDRPEAPTQVFSSFLCQFQGCYCYKTAALPSIFSISPSLSRKGSKEA